MTTKTTTTGALPKQSAQPTRKLGRDIVAGDTIRLHSHSPYLTVQEVLSPSISGSWQECRGTGFPVVLLGGKRQMLVPDHAYDVLPPAKPIRCLACGGNMYLSRAHFADGLSTVPHMSHASLECADCGEYMHLLDAVITGWATEAELAACPAIEEAR